MSDRELLELAAKAAGLYAVSDIADCWVSDNRNEDGYEIFPREGFATINGVWNPLTDDGDALRLAVKLELIPTYMRFSDRHTRYADYEESLKDTRRAIVRAAAEIGKVEK